MSEEEIFKMLLVESIDKYPLLNELFAIRDSRGKRNDYTIFVNGYISLDVINKAIEKVNLLNNLKEIEKSHQEENGKLRVELEQEKEKNKDLNEGIEKSSARVTQLTVENSELKYHLYKKQQIIDELTQNEEKLKIELGKEKEKNKDLEEKLKIAVAMLTKGTYPEKNEGDNDFDKKFIAVDKIKELVDEHIPKQPNIITGEIEYTPNTNANSFLTQEILMLLED